MLVLHYLFGYDVDVDIGVVATTSDSSKARKQKKTELINGFSLFSPCPFFFLPLAFFLFEVVSSFVSWEVMEVGGGKG